MTPAKLFVLLTAFLTSILTSSAHAQTSGTGTLSGRVFNPATNEYVRNAEIQVEGTNLTTYSRDDGSYVLPACPPES